MVNEDLANKIAIVAGGADSPGCGIVQALLERGATVIVPVPDAASINKLRGHIGDFDPAKLITHPTDFTDYERAEELVEIIVSEYGQIDLVVAAKEEMCGHSPMLDADIIEWQKTLDCNVTSSFVIDRLCLPLLSKNGGMMIVISNTDHLLPGTASPMAKLAGFAGIEISKVFAEEARPHNIHFYHLLINNVAPVPAEKLGEGEREITPAMIGAEVIRIYATHLASPQQTFHFFTGRPIEANILSRLEG